MTALTRPARRARTVQLDHLDGVATRGDLRALGIDAMATAAQLSADRWRRAGRAIVLHNGRPTKRQQELIAVINCGPRSVLTSFTAASRWGLRGWARDDIYVLGPQGARDPKLAGLVLHRTRHWTEDQLVLGRGLHRIAPALLIAAAGFANVRPAYGLIAAAVQQRLTTADDLGLALQRATRMRHRASLGRAINDIAQGAQALSEIDFVRLCARHGLPAPRLQAVRVEPGGRRRYLDAEWVLPDGRVVGVEVDGALHLVPARWIDDQLRQNWIVIGETRVLRFASVLVREEDPVMIAQLRQVLLGS